MALHRVARVSTVAAMLAVAGACAEPADGWRPVTVQPRLASRIVEIPEGYALAGGEGGLRAYDDQGRERWRLPAPVRTHALARLVGGGLWVASTAGGSLQFDRVSFAGTLEDSFVVSDPAGALEPWEVVLDPAGQAWVHGGTSKDDLWQGTVGIDGEVSLQQSTMEHRSDVKLTGDGGRFEINSVYTPTQSWAAAVLHRVDAAGDVVWSRVLDDGGSIVAVGRDGDVYIHKFVQDFANPTNVFRHFDADGSLLTEWSDRTYGHLDLIKVLEGPDGELVWVDVQTTVEGYEIAETTLRMRVLGDDGLRDLAAFEIEGTGLADAAFIDDVLHVLTDKGLTRVAHRGPIPK